VLTLIGVGLILLNLARNLPASIVLFFCVLVFMDSPVARAIADWPSYWSNGFYDPEMTLSDVLQGFLVVGYFPFLPWIIYPLIGFVVGTSVLGESREPHDNRPALYRGMAIGGVLMCLSGGLLMLRYLAKDRLPAGLQQPFTMFPPSVDYVLMTVGISVMCFCAGHLWLDQRLSSARFVRFRAFVGLFSRHSFTVYLLHHVVHLWPLWIYGVSHGREATWFWRQAMSVELAVALACVFLVACYLLLRWMENSAINGIEGWMRWLCG
jgi:uncharacterized membrane protein